MRILLLLVFLGLAVINASPVDSMTQMPVRPEEDVLEEVITDGFLVDHIFGTSATTEPPKINTTIQEPSEVFTEGSGLLENHLASKTEYPEAPTTIQTSSQPISDSSEGSGFLVTPTLPIIQTPEPTTIPASPHTNEEGSGVTDNCISSSTDSGEGSGNFFDPSSSTTTTTLAASTKPIPTTTEQKMPQNRRLPPVHHHEIISKENGVSTQVQPFNGKFYETQL
ncbi:mucin-2-like [Cyprinodon tularosa]|uniref:mucin-2-like n=1 Tax=Cyprinodon tularosa TaxID=77115 RepID=UPI0018E1F412|nr:mucin-2-like [Cyprinodon tularosa]